MNGADEQDSILSSSLTLQRRTLWFGEIGLYESRLAVTGWNWTGAIDHSLPFDDIRRIEVWPVSWGVNLAIHPEEKRALYCRIAEQILSWANELREDERPSLDLQPERYPSPSAGLSTRPSLVGGISAPRG